MDLSNNNSDGIIAWLAFILSLCLAVIRGIDEIIKRRTKIVLKLNPGHTTNIAMTELILTMAVKVEYQRGVKPISFNRAVIAFANNGIFYAFFEDPTILSIDYQQHTFQLGKLAYQNDEVVGIGLKSIQGKYYFSDKFPKKLKNTVK